MQLYFDIPNLIIILFLFDWLQEEFDLLILIHPIYDFAVLQYMDGSRIDVLLNMKKKCLYEFTTDSVAAVGGLSKVTDASSNSKFAVRLGYELSFFDISSNISSSVVNSIV